MENETESVKFVRSSENYANVFTKNVSGDVYSVLTDYLCFSVGWDAEVKARWGVVNCGFNCPQL